VKKLLLVTNSFAGSVSTRAHEVIVKALSADHKVEAETTKSRDHATELARDAVERGFDAVVAFGGDGTINEVAQALVGTEVALGVLPGGSTNVLVRSLGIPNDPIDATAFLSSHLRSGTKRRINVGRLESRYFLFSAGMGLDAEVVKRVENDPRRRTRSHNYLFVRHALDAGATRYRAADASLTMTVDGHDPEKVLFAICCNGRPFTYFRSWPVDAVPQASLELGLDFLALTKIHASTIPRIIWSIFVSRSHPHWRNASYHHDVQGATLESTEALPVQVDGDYIGELTRARLDLVPNALDLLV
jgi:diacylglycerol kinase family enzyme